ncbi:MAG: penicillin-binding transpeptidase domain-containing protein [Faecousia sp.]
MNKLAKRAWFAYFLAAAMLVGVLVIVVRYFVNGPDWMPFQNDGVIVDRSGTVLMDNTQGRTLADDATVRASMLQILGDNEGYITPYLLNEYGDELAGFNRISGTRHMGGGEGRMTLTLSASVQRAALNALSGQHGTVGVYNYKTGEILCMVSSPTYDPWNVPDVEGNPEQYNGVYVNRFLHSAYAPGSTFKLVTAAAALERISDIKDRTFYCEGSAQIGSETVICNGVHGMINFQQALCQSCNVAFAQIADELGADVLTDYAQRFGVTDSLSFDGFVTKSGNFDLSEATAYEAAWAGVGQYTDQINPCQYMTFMGAIANGGQAATPYLVDKVTYGSKTKYEAKTEMGDKVLSASAADTLAEMMHYNVVNNYGEWYFSGLYAGAKSGTAERGEGLTSNALLTGFVQSEDYPLAFVVVIEGGGAGSTACTPVIRQVLDACVVAMGS